MILCGNWPGGVEFTDCGDTGAKCTHSSSANCNLTPLRRDEDSSRSFQRASLLCCTTPHSLLSHGYRGALSLGIKRPGVEADHSHPSSAEFKNVWSYTSTPQYIFMAWCLVKHRDNFTFTFLPFTFIELVELYFQVPIRHYLYIGIIKIISTFYTRSVTIWTSAPNVQQFCILSSGCVTASFTKTANYSAALRMIGDSSPGRG
jgi:hypothetical protein